MQRQEENRVHRINGDSIPVDINIIDISDNEEFDSVIKELIEQKYLFLEKGLGKGMNGVDK